ncbi:MAG: flagellar biosynthesis anti-sigma factor FlgM [Proteobacteria bacterium]|nr:flagellar biosynthesis anti-sigma factor FlgM [Pseudomonadota bacterium]
MKILNDKNVSLLDNLIKAPNNRPLKENTTTGNGNSDMSDKVELSSRKQEIETIKEKVMALPVIRQEKVDQIREAIKAETYNVKGELVARSMLKSHLLDEIF